ncbi:MULTISPECIES: hypothetical protein [Alicyclobacillus]|uniref:Uncharacterized protein n=1 Tax=Alicyclobacillus acidoterrestris (strain ATCC 49025 / DSM 3922 / CIP 106132 / NCIMB 13137 / GD3B) TaxID=1356854 RepID=A0A9E6ZNK4_ALIAG|nr:MULTISPECIES: hypothetical protein [Alicyclobacillus]UNO51091.1 hypothetical protein K1I37_20930 [Alicyclobacillus acidoterrestris]GEO28012.1 hypothetical protein AAC03nite_37970 [Alicyclobacillus acidoterrestris]
MIKGFSEPKRIPRVGKIYLGVKTVNDGGKEYPKATDYFVVRADGTNTSDQAAAAFHEVYGDKPKEITICFPTDDPEQFMPQALCSYKGSQGRGRLWCKGDGETAVREDGNGGYTQVHCAYKECEFYKAKQCKELTRLIFLLPEVKGIGIWELDSTSYYTSQNLIGSIQLIRQLTRGRIAMIPLTLRVVPMQAQVAGHPKTIYVLDLKLENVKMMDLLNKVATIALDEPTMDFERPNDNEMPDDLYIESSIVPDDSIPSQTLSSIPKSTINPQPAKQNPISGLPVIPVADLGEGETVGVLVDSEFKKHKGQDFVKLTIEMARTGDRVEAMTGETELVSAIRQLQKGTTIHIKSTKLERVPTPVIQELAIVS